MEIKVLGTGCPRCKKVFADVTEVVSEMNLEANLEKIEDIQKILGYGIMSVPALMIDEKIVFTGKAPSKEELKKYISNYL